MLGLASSEGLGRIRSIACHTFIEEWQKFVVPRHGDDLAASYEAEGTSYSKRFRKLLIWVTAFDPTSSVAPRHLMKASMSKPVQRSPGTLLETRQSAIGRTECCLDFFHKLIESLVHFPLLELL